MAAVLLAGPAATAAGAAVTVTGGEVGEGGTVTFTVASDSVLGDLVSISTKDGTAKAATDFTPVEGMTATPRSGAPVEVVVQTTQDAAPEPDEDFTLEADPQLMGETASAKGTIRNDDAPMIVAGAGPTVEGAKAVLAVALLMPVNKPVTVKVTTAPGTATVPADFTATTATVAFAAGETVKALQIPTAEDAVFEGDETFTATLGEASGGVAPAAPVTLTITENDPKPTLSLEGGPPVAEGDTGTTPTGGRLKLSAAAAVPVVVTVATAPSGAKSDEDFVPFVTDITFAPGETERLSLVDVKGDTTIEKDERFFLIAAAKSNVEVPNGLVSVVLTIRNDDRDTVAPVLTLSAPKLTSKGLRTKVGCPADEEKCTGRVTFFKDADRRSKDAGLRKEVRLGGASVSVPGGQTVTVTAPISAARRKLLKRAKKPRISVFLLAKDAEGNSASARTRARITVR